MPIADDEMCPCRSDRRYPDCHRYVVGISGCENYFEFAAMDADREQREAAFERAKQKIAACTNDQFVDAWMEVELIVIESKLLFASASADECRRQSKAPTLASQALALRESLQAIRKIRFAVREGIHRRCYPDIQLVVPKLPSL